MAEERDAAGVRPDEEKPEAYTQALLAAIVESSDDAIITKDLDGRITSWNGGAQRIFGYTPEEIIGRPVSVLIPDDRQGEEADILARIRRGERVDHFDTIRRRKDGSLVPISLTISPIRTADGTIIGASKIARDISERGSRALLAAIVDSSDDAIVSKDLNGFITSWNHGAERIFGYAPEEIIGKHITTLIPTDRHDEETRILARIRAGDRVNHFDTMRRRKDGSLVPISVTVSPVRGAGGTIIGASKVARDISERRRLEEAQQALSREVNHRSKNLLAVVQSIIRYTVSHSEPQDFMRRISERLQALSANQDLLIESSWRGAEITRLVRSQLDHVEGLSLDRVSLEGEPIFLTPSAAQALGIALHELATNAVKFGALSTGAGRVTAGWRLENGTNGQELVVTWLESGGPEVATPEYAGFGSAIIKRITGQAMGGAVTTSYAPTGLTWELRAPAAGLIGPPQPLEALTPKR
jgi:PAS domain S-box-containing protein